jgi:aminoglycoside 2''-phosphotransferase
LRSAALALARVATGLRAAFPDLAGIEPLRIIGTGFGNTVVETADGLIFRLARHGQAAEGQRREARFLPALAERLPVSVPVPRWYAGPTAHFPFGVIGYRKLPGTPLQPAMLIAANAGTIAADVAGLLLALHRFPVDEAARLGLPGQEEERAELATLREAVVPTLRAGLPRTEYGVIARWWDRLLADERCWHFRPVVRHGDLWYENLLVDTGQGRIAGVLDFECAAIGDPAQDFATQLHLGERFTARVIAAYEAAGGALDDDFPQRLRRRWELREFDGLRLAIEAGDEAELVDAIGKLRRGPILQVTRQPGG